MRKVFLILILGLLNFQTNVFSSDKIINQLKSGGNIIFIRHAIAPGNGDPDNFDLKDCSTQRNLSKNGIEQSKKIGEFFKDNKIKVSNKFQIHNINIWKINDKSNSDQLRAVTGICFMLVSLIVIGIYSNFV